ncbi:hypothetical protein [Rhodoferax saidenbachensis]|uniref:TonB-dependent receptor n=1 Tax=Rhodoferax saidenbachensis TaxID=1484693 RepID=A0A1P8KE87_9BURK|nr:hypothetical protein [Rhodoferax saidenbachensis]APW44347.1 TonB-dependent receptor [Rhodoferax saidenbachensis]
MKTDRKYLLWALAYAIAGMVLGIYMAASQNHAQHVTHAHVLLLGFVTSFLYGVMHKLWLDASMPLLAKLQLIAHQVGVLGMCVGLFLLYGGLVPVDRLEPVLGIASIAVLLGAVLMFFMAVASRDAWA